MLQVTGHAGGVPIASPRGRSVSFPFSGNYGYIRNLRRFFCDFIGNIFTYTIKQNQTILSLIYTTIVTSYYGMPNRSIAKAMLVDRALGPGGRDYLKQKFNIAYSLML